MELPSAKKRTKPIDMPNLVKQGYNRIEKSHAKYKDSQSMIWILKWGYN